MTDIGSETDVTRVYREEPENFNYIQCIYKHITILSWKNLVFKGKTLYVKHYSWEYLLYWTDISSNGLYIFIYNLKNLLLMILLTINLYIQ